MVTTMKSRFPLLLLIGVLFLASVCVSYGISHDTCYGKCLQKSNHVNEALKHHECQIVCEEEDKEERGKQTKEEDEDERPQRPGQWRPQRPGQWRPSSEPKEDDEDERPQRPGQWRPSSEPKEDDEDERPQRPGQERPQRPGQWRPSHEPKEDDEDERPQRPGQQRPQRPGQWRPSHKPKEDDEDERPQRPGQQRPQRPGQWRPSHEPKEDDEDERPQRPLRPQRPGQQRPSHEPKEDDEDERPQRPLRPQRPGQQRPLRPQRPEQQRPLRPLRPQRPGHEGDKDEEGGSSSSKSQGRRNPFFFRSNNFETLFENENGQVRLLQRFDKRSNLFENLQNYRLVEYRAKPNTLLLPHHIDADLILNVLSGKAILTVVNPNDRNSFNLECGDSINIPAGTTAYLVNQDQNEDLRIVNFIIPVNRPGKYQSFFPADNLNQESYLNGFSKNILEASYNANYEDIEKALLQEQEQEPPQWRGHKGRPQSQQKYAIIKISRQQIEQLSRTAKSISKRSTSSSQTEPISLRSRDNLIYSNKFGKFFEITPKNDPQLEDLDILVNSVQINEGSLLLPHYNSRTTVVAVVNEGKGNLELVGLKNEQQEEEDEDEQQEDEEERSRQVQRYKARLSPGDVIVIPAGYPFAIDASSDLSLLGLGINAQNNKRNFLAGEEDNVISQIQNPVKELAFPGSAQEVNSLIQKQKQSYFANAQPQQRDERIPRRKGGPLSSILDAFY